MQSENISRENKISTIISHLIQNCPVYVKEDFDYLCDNMPKRPDCSFHYFIFCINWQSLYSTPNRLTLYDILNANNAIKVKTRSEQFTKAFASIKNLFEGQLSTSSDLIIAKDRILNRLSEGFKQIGINNNFRHKGIHEFFVTIFEKLGGVDYETHDFVSPYLTGVSQKFRVLTDLYDKFLPAYKVSTIFNSEYRTKMNGVEIDNFFALHVLLRHTVPYKIKYEFQPNESLDSLTIKNGLGQSVAITSREKNMGTEIISKDGVFYRNSFSTNQTDYFDLLRSGQTYSADFIAKSLYDKLNMLVPILIKNANPNFSPNIVYYDHQLYGIEISKHKLREEQVIEVCSFYPLNSDWQNIRGISKVDLAKIINKSDIP